MPNHSLDDKQFLFVGKTKKGFAKHTAKKWGWHSFVHETCRFVTHRKDYFYDKRETNLNLNHKVYIKVYLGAK